MKLDTVANLSKGWLNNANDFETSRHYGALSQLNCPELIELKAVIEKESARNSECFGLYSRKVAMIKRMRSFWILLSPILAIHAVAECALKFAGRGKLSNLLNLTIKCSRLSFIFILFVIPISFCIEEQLRRKNAGVIRKCEIASIMIMNIDVRVKLCQRLIRPELHI